MEPLTGPLLLAATITAALVIIVAGSRLSAQADVLGEHSNLSQTLSGTLLLGAVTSLPGIIASVVAAAEGRPALSATNAIGGIAAQTAFLAIADACYPRANLEHDAAAIDNILQAGLMVVVLLLPVAATTVPFARGWPVHPVTPIMVGAYLIGVHTVQRSSEQPMWFPRGRIDTTVLAAVDRPPEARPVTASWPRFGVLALLVSLAGWALITIAEVCADRYGIEEAVLGAVGTGLVTSLPELVVTIAAVRRGALSLAVGAILGGNAFDALFLAMADTVYTDGSIYHAIPPGGLLQLVISCLMAAVLLLGLATRQRSGPANIGTESMLVLLLYAVSVTALFL